MNLDELERLLREATAGPWIGAGPSFGDPLPRYTTDMVTEWEDDDGCRTICEFGYAHHDDENEANAALIAALRNSAEELIRDARRLEATRYQLRVEQAKFQQAIRVLSSIHATLYPPRFAGPDGKVHEFHSPLVHQQMQEISDRIRAIPDELKALDAIAQEGK
jgi:predicted lipoprotein